MLLLISLFVIAFANVNCFSGIELLSPISEAIQQHKTCNLHKSPELHPRFKRKTHLLITAFCRRKRVPPGPECDTQLAGFCSTRSELRMCKLFAKAGGLTAPTEAPPNGSEPNAPSTPQQSAKGNSGKTYKTPVADLSAMQNLNFLGNKFQNETAKKLSRLAFRGSGQSSKRNESAQRQKYNTELEVNLERNLLSNIFEADILLSPDQAETVTRWFKGFLGALGQGKRKKRKVGTTRFELWNEMPIPYSFAPAFSKRVRKIVHEAIKLWEGETCVRWQENAPGLDRIEFTNGRGCSSFVGRAGGTQDISIYANGCDTVGIASHEIGHSLGFFHEQNRPDQRSWVTINYRNILPTYYNNFVPQSTSDTDDYGVSYDYGSVMHYDGWTRGFTLLSNQYAIQANDERFQQTMGQRNGPSFADVKQVNMAYCHHACASSSLDCEHSGYQNPNDCSKCKCPPGFGGKSCDTVAASEGGSCGGELLATTVRGKISGKFERGQACNWLIKAPKGFTPTIKFTNGQVFSFPCTEPCSSGYLEVNMGRGNFDNAGARLCCRTTPKGTFTPFSTEGNELMVMSRSPSSSYSFELEYWSDAPCPAGKTCGGTVGSNDGNTAGNTGGTTGGGTDENTGGPTGGSTGGTGTTEGNVNPTTTTVIPNTFAPIEVDDCGCQQWSQWSECSYQCGGCGNHERRRTCKTRKAGCRAHEKERCNLEACTHVARNKPGISFEGGVLNFFYDGCCVGLIRNKQTDLCGGLIENLGGLGNLFGGK